MEQIEREYRDALDGLRFSEGAKERMVNHLMEQREQAPGKRRGVRALRAGLIAAALAVGCVLSIAAGLPARVYNFATGGTLTALPGTGDMSMTLIGEETAPVKAEDGRLWFEADGQKLDITDKVDENTPYIYEHTDAATGEKGYVIVGGTVDDFGWVELVLLDGSIAMSGNNFDTVSIAELYEQQESGGEETGGVMRIVDAGRHQPWFQAALDRLGLDL